MTDMTVDCKTRLCRNRRRSERVRVVGRKERLPRTAKLDLDVCVGLRAREARAKV